MGQSDTIWINDKAALTNMHAYEVSPPWPVFELELRPDTGFKDEDESCLHFPELPFIPPTIWKHNNNAWAWFVDV